MKSMRPAFVLTGLALSAALALGSEIGCTRSRLSRSLANFHEASLINYAAAIKLALVIDEAGSRP